MGQITNVIKRNGQRNPESFSREKLQASIIASCLCTHTPVGQAETTADNICDQVEAWASKHKEVTTHDIRNITAKLLETHHPEAAYLYKQRNITI